MEQCKFVKAWIGQCKKEANVNGFCKEHIGMKCVSCGAQATHECEETGQVVCGAPLCDDCEHTTAEDGTNGGIGFFRISPLPKGYNEHCKRSEQVYKPWFIRKSNQREIYYQREIFNLKKGGEKLMKCPKCQMNKNKVLDSRYYDNEMGEYISRRRKCKICGNQWTTRETFILGPIQGSKHIVEFLVESEIEKPKGSGNYTWVLYTKTTNLDEAEKMLEEALELGWYKSVRIKKVTKIVIKKVNR
jgi:transcriptional regulator NrdR family protein